jgi:autotransporter-associated beta strand protein
MNLKHVAPRAAALLLVSTSASAVAAQDAIIVGEDSQSWAASAATGLQARLEAAGYNVTIITDPTTLTGNLNGIAQVWDVRPNVALTSGDSSNYLSYLNASGGLFLLGEHSGFATRNNSLSAFIAEAGGGNVAVGSTSVQDQYVTDIFNGSGLIATDAATSFYVPASGTFTSPGTGTFITTTEANGAGLGTGVAFGAGSLANAPGGRLLSYLDVNTFQAQFYDATPALRSLIDRMIGFVAGSFQVDPNLPPVGGPAIIDGSQPSFNLGDSAATGSTISFDGGTLDLAGGSDPANRVTADVSITDNGAFINTAGNSGTFAGAISGPGGIIVNGKGSVALTGANDYQGGTVIMDSSTVEIDSAQALGTGGVVLMQGRLRFGADGAVDAPVTLMAGLNALDTATNAVSLGGEITGTGGFVKTGAGKLNLTGTSTYSGATIVAGGRLAVNGSIANSGVIVESGGSIGGNGVVGGLIVRTNATAAPGNSIGQLRAATTVLFERGSVYQVEVDASGASDRVVATGIATLEGGTVQVLAEAGDYRPQTTYQILTGAGGVIGEFEDVTSNLAFLLPRLTYGTNAVTLTLTRNDVKFIDVASTTNQRATAAAINASFSAGTPVYFELVGQSAPDARDAFDSLSGEVHASALTVAAQQTDDMRRALLTRMALPGREGITLWTDVNRAWNELDGNGNTVDVSSDAHGFQAGLETQMDGIRIGLSGGYNNGDTTLGSRLALADIEVVSGAVYAGGDFGALAVRLGASYSDYDFRTRRTAEVGDLSQELIANYGGRAIQAFGEVGSAQPLGNGTVEPFVGLNAIWLKNRAFTETGGSFALAGEAMERGRAWSSVGLKASIPLGVGSPVSIGATVGWQHALTRRTVASDLSFAAGGPDFRIEGAPLARDAALIDAGVHWTPARSLGLSVTYTGSIADQGQSHTARAVLSANF